MTRPASPPPMSFFDEIRPACGPASFALRLDPLQIELRGLDVELAAALRERFRPFGTERSEAADSLVADVERDERDYFLAPPATPELNPILLDFDAERVRYLGYRLAGWFDTFDGRGKLVLAGGGYEPAAHAVENWLRAAVAWQAATRGGALVHAASAVLNGRAYLFYGESGAGKSTLAEVNTRARVVSDDLSLVLPGESGALELVGSPFRGTYAAGAPVRGRFPLRAGFRIVQDTTAEVRPVPRVVALGELVGNLPFVAEAFSRRPELFARVQAAFDGLPLKRLHFRKDDSYWEAVRRAGL